jgi:hypothetical protein
MEEVEKMEDEAFENEQYKPFNIADIYDVIN